MLQATAQGSMALRRELSITSLTMAVVTSTIGSGWLFAPYFTARLAGPASLMAWVIGGVMAFLLAMVFAELGALVNSSGALAQIPMLSHGRLAGFIGGWSVWLSYVALPTVEVLALLEYLASILPWLTTNDAGNQMLTLSGQIVAVVLLILLTWINLAGVKQLARWINGLTLWKLIVPLVVSVVLMVMSHHWGNLVSHPIADHYDVITAIGSGGILFSLLGFRTAMDLGGEARNPQRDIPLAMALGLGISLVIYLILQLSFLVSVPPAALANGWSSLQLSNHGGPMVALAMGLGLGWVVVVLLIDAVISPGATALTYLGVSARVSWMMGECGLLPRRLRSINRQGVPHLALISSLLISSALLWIGPSWHTVVNFLTATLIIALATGPVSLLALRRQLPEEHRAYRLPQARLICSAAFVMATWATSWCGRSALEGAVLLIIVPSLVYIFMGKSQGHPIDAWAGSWWILYLGLLMLDMELFSQGQPLALSTPAHLAVLAALALLILPIAVHSALPDISPHALTHLGNDQPQTD